MSRKEEVLLIGQLQRMIMYLLVPLAVFCRSGRTYPDQGLVAYSTVLYFVQQTLVVNFAESLGEIKQNYIHLDLQGQVLSNDVHSEFSCWVSHERMFLNPC